MLHTDPNKRHEFVLLFDVTDANPNGNPDAGNLPRIDPQTMQGIVTDVCIKRKIRDYVQMVLCQKIFIQSETALNNVIRTAAEAIGYKGAEYEIPEKIVNEEDVYQKVIDWIKQKELDEIGLEIDGRILRYDSEKKFNKATILSKLNEELSDTDIKTYLEEVINSLAEAAKRAKTLDKTQKDQTKEKLIGDYFDIRMFGAVLSTGLNAGQVRGPVQLTFGRSIDPIHATDIPITRIAITKGEDTARKQTEMGRKALIPYGLYRVHGYYNPFFADKLPVKPTEQDLQYLWEALTNMFDNLPSSSKAGIATRGLWVFTHENKKGDAPSHKLFEKINIDPVDPLGDKTPPRKIADYNGKITVPECNPEKDSETEVYRCKLPEYQNKVTVTCLVHPFLSLLPKTLPEQEDTITKGSPA